MAISLISCKKDEDHDDAPQLKIRIKDIPAEYEGKFVNTFLGTADHSYRLAHNNDQNPIIMYDEVTIKLLKEFDYTPFTEKGEYRLDLLIFDYNKYLWIGRSSNIIDITKETTTISFKALTKMD